MEPKPVYFTQPAELPAVRCGSCGVTLAQIEEIDGRAWLSIGAVQLYAAHGRCACGAEWHWTSSEALLQKILERAKRR
jgi:hypothetical protein